MVAECLAGTLLDDDAGRRAAQRAFLDDVLAAVPVEDHDSTVAEHHAEPLAHVRKTGSKRGSHDLIVAATARATGRILLTTDEHARFDRLPEVRARIVAT